MTLVQDGVAITANSAICHPSDLANTKDVQSVVVECL